ncbi:PrsW family intramembrane metalloprotease [Lapillicoccus jejuensis]|uniref:PrsW family intramembrane metalloprotease n=1 Tax=Lapillicoccus jejuensis TaxID=402171 RepID=UPI00114E76AB|nr:PrsW family intramembrane metalloprotease [Lapillicoccus jejuensis]
MSTGDPRWSTAGNVTSRPTVRRVLLYGVVVALFLLCWAVLGRVFSTGFGLQTTVLAALFAAIPLLVVIPTYLWIDRYEAEPNRYLAFAFLWGALCATVGALFLNTFFSIALVLLGEGQEQADLLGATVSAPIVEEGLKGLGILLIVLVRRRQFDGIVDGIVYAGMVGAGFAFTENILYLGRMYAEYGTQGLTALFLLRCVMGPFAHPLFTSMTGIGLGVAVSLVRTRGTKVLAGLAGYLAAVGLHALWNLSASTGNLLGLYVLVQVPIFLGYVATLVWARTREGRQIRLYLSQYADAGWLGHQEVAMLGSLPARRNARTWARATGGAPALASMKAFQDAASDLALLRSRIVRGVAEPQAQTRERELLDSLVAHRAAFTGTAAFARR